MRMAALSHEELYDTLRKAIYPVARADDIQRRQEEQEHSTAWALARNEAARRLPLDLKFCPTSPDVGDCRYVGSSDDELFGSDS